MVEKRDGVIRPASEGGGKPPKSVDVRRANPQPDFPRVPMDEYRTEVVECIEHNQSSVVIGETGSGKTTRIPDFLLDSFPDARIAVTQPRRVAARSVCRFVADRRGEPVGGEVGYQVRFEDQTTEGTRANFMTDGILLRKLHYDPLLTEYDIVMVDEAHERSLNIDFVLGLLKHVQAERAKQGMTELKVIVTSATIEKKKFAEYFGDAPVVEVPGRMYPVDTHYVRDWSDEKDCEVQTRWGWELSIPKLAAKRVGQAISEGEGDILIFMPGEEDIRNTIQEIEKLHLSGIEVMPLFGAMAPEDQDRIFEKNPKRKVIVSTNIAETSVTIDGVRFVIDSGLIKQKEFDPATGIEALKTNAHAKSGCEQRRGRAGRTAPGTCYRLYTEKEFNDRAEYQTPEIARSNLDHVILAMKKIGIEDVRGFDFIDRPAEESISQAIETLKMLGALDRQENITEIGRVMAELPLRPELARMVIEAEKYHCTGKVCTIAAMMGEKSVFVRPKDKELEADKAHMEFSRGSDGSDFLKLLEVWNQWSASGFNERWARDHFLNVRQLYEVREVRSQLMRELKHQKISVEDVNGNDPIAIQKCIAAGLIQHLMISAGRHSYERVVQTGTAYAGDIFIHPSSASFGDASGLMIGASVVTTKKTFARRCQPVKPNWLPEIAPQLLDESGRTVEYDPKIDEVKEKIVYSLRGRYTNIAEQSLPVTDNIASEHFIRALAEGRVELPSVRHNFDVLQVLEALHRRSGGKVQVPELLAWYRQQASGIKSKREAWRADDELRINVAEYCSPEMKAEIDTHYPEKITVRGHELDVVYEYDSGNPNGWSESDRTEQFNALVMIPDDIIFTLEAADFPAIGVEGRPGVMYRLEDERSFVAYSKLESLKAAVDTRRLENAWYSFKKPTTQYPEIKVSGSLPTLESIGARPIPYAKNYRGEDVYAYPAYRLEQTYNITQGAYIYTFRVDYYRTEEESKQNNDRALEIKNQEDAKIRRRADRETLLAPTKERYFTMRTTISQVLDRYAVYGLTSDEYYDLTNKLEEVGYALRGLDPDPEKATKLMDEIEKTLVYKQADHERRMLRIPGVQARIDALAKRVGKITHETYSRFGLSYEQFTTLSRRWLEANDVLRKDRKNSYGFPVPPDPEKATAILNEIMHMIPDEQGAYWNRKNDSRAYYEDEGNDDDDRLPDGSREEKGTGALATLLGDLLRKQNAREEDMKKEKTEKPTPPIVREVQKPAEREKMTDELRTILADSLANARFFLDTVRAAPEPDKKAENADKISKLRAKAAEIKRDLNAVEQELKTIDDGPRARGKVADIVKKSEKAAEDLSRLQNGREDWPDRFKTFMNRTKEIAKLQDVELDEATLQKIKTKVTTMARRKGVDADVDGELEGIIIDSI